jgi:hypothetical protein
MTRKRRRKPAQNDPLKLGDVEYYFCKKVEQHDPHEETYGAGLSKLVVSCTGNALEPTEQQPESNPPEESTETPEIDSNETKTDETEEVVEEEKKEPIPFEGKMNDMIMLPAPGGIDSVPDSQMPFYVIASDGMFMQIRNLLGRAIIKQKTIPKNLEKMDSPGLFTFDAAPIPAKICAQVVDFFQRIFDHHKTEAEVILLMNRKTKEWGLMIPTQKTSYSAVDSRVDPEKVPAGWSIVGTMHSHCDFGAFHSGTDKSDADDMNGVHFTIGHLEREMPEIAAMVAVNGVIFDYGESFKALADFSDLNAGEAPEEWDEFVIPTANLQSQHKPVGYELFDKYPKQTNAVQKYVPPTTPYNYNNAGYRPYAGGYTGNPGSWRGDQDSGSWRDNFEDDDWAGWRNGWGGVGYTAKKDDFADDDAYQAWLKRHAGNNNDVPQDMWDWDDELSDTIVTAVISSGCITDEDMEYANDHKNEAAHPLFWRNLFIRKLSAVALTLRVLEIDVQYGIKPKKVTRETK